MEGIEEIGGDVCVPISRMPELVIFARTRMDESGLNGAIWGHVGDGNFHRSIMYDPSVEGKFEAAEQTSDAIVLKAIEAGGHLHRRTRRSSGIMKRTKQMYDPKAILNPGKNEARTVVPEIN